MMAIEYVQRLRNRMHDDRHFLKLQSIHHINNGQAINVNNVNW